MPTSGEESRSGEQSCPAPLAGKSPDNEGMAIRGAVALVTGASSGIGHATAEALADAGARVVVHGRDGEALAALAKRIDATPLVADLAAPTEVDRLARTALDVAGHVDILVANAGVGRSGQFADMRSDDVDLLVAVNLAAPLRLARALIPTMIDQGRGYLAFVSSIAGRMGVAGEAVYAATKAGLDTFAESVRLELRGTGVGVGVLVPGTVATRFFERRGQPYRRRRPRPLDPDRLAADLVHMIERRGTEVYRPRWLRAPVAVRAVAPGMYRRLAGRYGGS